MSNRLRETRRNRNLRIQDLKWLIHVTTGRTVSEATLSRLERGEVNSSNALKAAIARALKVAPEELWGEGTS